MKKKIKLLGKTTLSIYSSNLKGTYDTKSACHMQ